MESDISRPVAKNPTNSHQESSHDGQGRMQGEGAQNGAAGSTEGHPAGAPKEREEDLGRVDQTEDVDGGVKKNASTSDAAEGHAPDPSNDNTRFDLREDVEGVKKHASTSDASPMFKPLPNSVLHKSPPKQQIKEPLFRPSPPSDDEDVGVAKPTQEDVISLHSSNSEASDAEVEEMISPYESLFTPPASSDDDDDTPLVLKRKSKPQPKKPTRYVMTHVQLPPLRRPREDYKNARKIPALYPRKSKWTLQEDKEAKDRKKEKKKRKDVEEHSSLVAALQAQLEHNSGIHDDEDMIVTHKRPQKLKNYNQRNAVAGPSRLPTSRPPPSEPPRSKTKPKRRLVESSSSSSSSDEQPVRKHPPKDKGKGARTAAKRQKITIDLTLDDDEDMDSSSNSKTPTPAPSTRRRSHSAQRRSRSLSNTPHPDAEGEQEHEHEHGSEKLALERDQDSVRGHRLPVATVNNRSSAPPARSLPAHSLATPATASSSASHQGPSVTPRASFPQVYNDEEGFQEPVQPRPSPEYQPPFESEPQLGTLPHPQRLNLRFYQHPPMSILNVNTFFHRQWLHGAVTTVPNISPSLPVTSNPNEVCHPRTGAPTPCLPWGGLRGGSGRTSSRSAPSADSDEDDVISLGQAPLCLDEDDTDRGDTRFDDDDDSDPEVPLLDLAVSSTRPRSLSASEFMRRDEKEVQEKQQGVMSMKPVKIDFVAEFKKKKQLALAKGKQKERDRIEASVPSMPESLMQAASVNLSSRVSLVQHSDKPTPLSGSFSYPMLGDPRAYVPPSVPLPQGPINFPGYLNSSLPSGPSSSLDHGMSYPGPLPLFKRPQGDLGVFMHDYSHRPPSPDAHTQLPSGSTGLDASVLSDFSTATGTASIPDIYSLTGAASNIATMPHFHQSDEVLLPASTAGKVAAGLRLDPRADSLFPTASGSLLDGAFNAAMEESWMTTAPQQDGAEYEYFLDTVDPTLICGGLASYDGDGDVLPGGVDEEAYREIKRRGKRKAAPMVVESVNSPRAETTGFEYGPESSASGTSKAGSLFSEHSGPSSARCRSRSFASSSSSSSPTSSVEPIPTSLTSMDGSASSISPLFSPSTLDPYNKPLRVLNQEASRPSGPRYETSPLSDLTSLSDERLSVISKTLGAQPSTFRKVNNLEVVIVKKRRKPPREWEEDRRDEELYCHQCRRKTEHSKARCVCKAKYCSRCITVRPKYLAILKPGGRVYSCPKCEKWCECDQCCNRRGEIYVPVKSRPRADSAFVTPLSPRPQRTRLLPSPPHSPRKDITPSSPDPQQQFPGPASFTPTLPSASAQPITNPGSTSQPPAPKKESRVFIGKVQPSWGLGRKPRTRELDPAPRAVWPKNPSGRGTVRYYIGSADFLQHCQLRLESTDDLRAGLASVASLDASEDENSDEELSIDDESPLVSGDKSDLPSSGLCQHDLVHALKATYECLGHSVILDEV